MHTIVRITFTLSKDDVSDDWMELGKRYSLRGMGRSMRRDRRDTMLVPEEEEYEEEEEDNFSPGGMGSVQRRDLRRYTLTNQRSAKKESCPVMFMHCLRGNKIAKYHQYYSTPVTLPVALLLRNILYVYCV